MEDAISLPDDTAFPLADVANRERRLHTVNTHPRDSRIERVVYKDKDGNDKRRYLLDGKTELIGSTTLLGDLFPEFDADAVLAKMRSRPSWSYGKYAGLTDARVKLLWSDIATTASDAGSRMHDRIEHYYDLGLDSWGVAEGEDSLADLSVEKAKFVAFERFRLEKGWKAFRAEWIIFDEVHGVGGMVDAVFVDPDGKHVVVDWKRSKELKTTNPWEPPVASGPAKGMPNCNFAHYQLQVSMYSWILESLYGLKMSETAYVVSIHPNFASFDARPVSVDRPRVIELLGHATVPSTVARIEAGKVREKARDALLKKEREKRDEEREREKKRANEAATMGLHSEKNAAVGMLAVMRVKDFFTKGVATEPDVQEFFSTCHRTSTELIEHCHRVALDKGLGPMIVKHTDENLWFRGGDDPHDKSAPLAKINFYHRANKETEPASESKGVEEEEEKETGEKRGEKKQMKKKKRRRKACD